MNFHKNLVPVVCDNQEDIKLLAQEMKNISLQDPHNIEKHGPYEGSQSFQEADERAERCKQNIVESGNLRIIRYQDKMLVNVVLTLMHGEFDSEWNLSMSHATPDGPVRVNDDLCEVIIKAFLEDSYVEVDPKAIYKNIRHFIRKK